MESSGIITGQLTGKVVDPRRGMAALFALLAPAFAALIHNTQFTLLQFLQIHADVLLGRTNHVRNVVNVPLLQRLIKPLLQQIPVNIGSEGHAVGGKAAANEGSCGSKNLFHGQIAHFLQRVHAGKLCKLHAVTLCLSQSAILGQT